MVQEQGAETTQLMADRKQNAPRAAFLGSLSHPGPSLRGCCHLHSE